MSECGEDEIRRVYGPERCPRTCSECEGAHHWIECSVDPEDEDEMQEFAEEHPGFTVPDEAFLLAHFGCKHCNALAEYDHDTEHS